MSGTPRTDALLMYPDCDDSALDVYYRNVSDNKINPCYECCVPVSFARQLETELAQKDALLREVVEIANEVINISLWCRSKKGNVFEDECKRLDEIKDKLHQAEEGQNDE